MRDHINDSNLSGVSGRVVDSSEKKVSNYPTNKLTVNQMGETVNDALYTGRVLLNFDNVDTSLMKDMRSLFYECESLTELNLSSFDTSKVAAMSFMFKGCRNLRSLNIESFNTSQVETMSALFYDLYVHIRIGDKYPFDNQNKMNYIVPHALSNKSPLRNS
jgi:surface protein